MQIILAAIIGLLLSPTVSFALSEGLRNTLSNTFGWGGIGNKIVILMVLAVGSWVAEMVANACGKGNIATIIKVATIFTAIILVIGVALDLLDHISNIFI